MDQAMRPDHLAWHETLDMHELVAFQSVGLMKIKKAFPEVNDPALKKLYKEAIDGLSSNIRELLQFYPMTPRENQDNESHRNNDIPFYAGDLLALFKTGVRNYSIAITETATPALRNVLKKHLNNGIDMHAKIFNYMYQRSYYPSYNLDQLLENDVKLANKALNQSF